MKAIYIPTKGSPSWQPFLADPALHWKRGRSAMELAVSWELATNTSRGLPREVASVLDQNDATRDSHLIFATPEHKVELPGGTYSIRRRR